MLPRRWTCCSCCTPITSRTPAPRPCAWRAAPAPIRMRRFPPASRRCGVRRMAAPTRRCWRCSSRSAPWTIFRSTWPWRRTSPATSGSWASVTGSTRTSIRAPRSSARCATRCWPNSAAPRIRCSNWRCAWKRSALKDEYFVSRKLYPNVDFYSGMIYSALGIPRSMFTVMFAIARTVGWVAHWQEMIADPPCASVGRGSCIPAHRRATTRRSAPATALISRRRAAPRHPPHRRAASACRPPD